MDFSVFKLTKILCGVFAICYCMTSGADLIDGEELNDPTRPFGRSLTTFVPAPTSSSRNFKVSFIRAGGESAVAVVNDERVAVGDLVDGALVTAIERDQVTLLISNVKVNVRLYQNSLKTAVSDQ